MEVMVIRHHRFLFWHVPVPKYSPYESIGNCYYFLVGLLQGRVLGLVHNMYTYYTLLCTILIQCHQDDCYHGHCAQAGQHDEDT